MAEHSRAHSAMSGGHKSKSKSSAKPHGVHVRRGKSGGFIATHHHKPDENGVTPEQEEHVLPDMGALQQHMADQMGDQPAAPAPTPDAGAGAVAPPAAAAAPTQ